MLACSLITNSPFACKLIMTVPTIIIMARGPPQGYYITPISLLSVTCSQVCKVPSYLTVASVLSARLGRKGASVAAYFVAGHNHIVTGDYMPTFTARIVGSS